VKAVHVELSDETVDFLMAEELRQHDLLEFVNVLDDELLARKAPVDDFGVLIILSSGWSTLRISKVLEMKPAMSWSGPSRISSEDWFSIVFQDII
jgi:hypothetical protein